MHHYSQEHRMLQRGLRALLKKEVIPYIDEWETNKYFPDDVFRVLGSHGYLGLLVPEEYGGVGGDYLMAAAFCEELGRLPAVGLSVAIKMHALVVLPAIVRYGTSALCSRLLPRAVSGELIGAYAFTEPGAGSDLAAIRTRAVASKDGYMLRGAKTFITNGQRAHFVIVLSKTDPTAGYKGFSSFVVEREFEGYSRSRTLDKLGWHCSDTAELHFDNVFIPQENLLGEVGLGWQQAMKSLDWERLVLCLGAISGASECLRAASDYANSRTVFGRPVSSFEANHSRIFSLGAELIAALSYCRECISRYADGRDVRLEAALAKIHCSELAVLVADTSLQLYGGYGYTSEYPPERWLRDLRLFPIGGGTSEVLCDAAYSILKKMSS